VVSGTNVTFTRASGTWPTIPVGSPVNPVSLPTGAQTLTSGGSLTLDAGSAAAFPLQNCTFKIQNSIPNNPNAVYKYQRRVGSTLEGITLSDDPDQAFSVAVDPNTRIVAEKFVRLHSTGIVSPGTSLETRREVVYHVPIGYTAGGEPAGKVTALDTLDSLDSWFTGSAQGELGGHQVTAVDGSNALRVTSAESPIFFGGLGQWSLVNFNWGGTNANFDSAWRAAGYLLSYDMQVKIRARNSSGTYAPYFMAGMNFRDQGSGNDLYTYGVSYLRARKTRSRPLLGSPGPWDFPCNTSILLSCDIPIDLTPPALFPVNFPTNMETGSNYWVLIFRFQDAYSDPAVVLWKRTASGFTWLAYKILSAGNCVTTPVGGYPRLTDWANLQVRVLEALPLSFTNGGPTIPLYGQTLVGATSNATARVNGSPIVSSGSWAGGNAAGILTLDRVEGNFVSGENLVADGVVVGRSSGTLGARTNFLRAYYGDPSAHGTANAVPTDDNRLSNPRVTSGSVTVHWPVDDVSAWAAENDYPTLVQWDGVNTGVTRLGTGTELNAVIRDASLTTPTSGSFTRSEVALHTAGDTSNSVYFDDFALQVEGSSASSTGFLPPLQQ